MKALLLCLLVMASAVIAAGAEDVLWYETPASETPWKIVHRSKDWRQRCLPIGNGSLGGMIYANPDKERVQFNEDTLWVGDEDFVGNSLAFADLYIEQDHDDYTDYRRQLDIARAVHTITYESDGVTYARRYFSSHPDKVMVFHFTADKPGAHSGRLFLEDLYDDSESRLAGNRIVLRGDNAGGSKLPNAARGDTDPRQAALPTDRRLQAVVDGATDPQLEELIFQYGRYLMIASSRTGTLPAHLQGIWNRSPRPAWWGDFHTDVNIQMCYWFADKANLSECVEPYIAWMNSIREVRRERSKAKFNVRGWTFGAMNGPFGGSAYFNVKGTSAWCAQNLFDHYRFTRDKQVLRDDIYPILRELCWFWEDLLKVLPDGTLVSPDGFSPEHGPKHVDGVSFDQQLIWDLFTNTIEASEDLGVDAEWREQLRAKRAKLLGPQIGRWGQLQEWMEDIDDPNNTHRPR